MVNVTFHIAPCTSDVPASAGVVVDGAVASLSGAVTCKRFLDAIGSLRAQRLRACNDALRLLDPACRIPLFIENNEIGRDAT
jgi:hypothetical protein